MCSQRNAKSLEMVEMTNTSPKPLVRVKMEPGTEDSKTTLFYNLLREVNLNNLDNTEVSGYA